MLDLVLATNNEHKLKEIKAMFAGLSIKVFSLSELDFKEEIEETGDTFTENAAFKASVIADRYKLLTLADDSGLEVDFLEGAPGVHSARYAGGDKSSEALCAKLLKEMAGVSAGERSAQFKTVMVLIDPIKSISKVFVGEVQGTITTAMTGENGFGYDPVFFYPPMSKTMAEMTVPEKNSISHRFRALEKVKTYLLDEYLR